MVEPHREIERKFLLAQAPGRGNPVYASSRVVDIEQVYLTTEGTGSRRVRKAIRAGLAFYYLTEKTRISDLVREEREREITASEYAELLRAADPDRAPLRKTRWVFEHNGLTWELDDFHLPGALWLLEVELPTEDTPAEPPKFLDVAAEVTHDRRFTSKSLARHDLDPGTLANMLREYGVAVS